MSVTVRVRVSVSVGSVAVLSVVSSPPGAQSYVCKLLQLNGIPRAIKGQKTRATKAYLS